jgi:hypothetical protein
LGAACGLDRLCAAASDRRARVRALAPGLLLVLGFGAALWLSLASGWLERELALAARPWGWFWLYGVSLDHFADLGRALAYFGAGAALLGAAVWWAGSPFGPALRLAIPTLAAVDLAFAVANPFVHPARAAGSAGSGAACYQAAAAITGEFGRHLSFRLLDSYGILDKDGERFGTYSATHYEPLVTLRHAAFFAALQAGGTPLVESPWNERSAFMGFLNAVPTAERPPPPRTQRPAGALRAGGEL